MDNLEDAIRFELGSRRLGYLELILYYQSCVQTHHAKKYPLEEINTVGLNHPLRPLSPTEIRAALELEGEVPAALLPQEVEVSLAEGTLPPPEKTKGSGWHRIQHWGKREKDRQEKHTTPFSTL